jgi:hypothetical protein
MRWRVRFPSASAREKSGSSCRGGLIGLTIPESYDMRQYPARRRCGAALKQCCLLQS